MGIVSYAQNFEDVLLWRALGSAGPGFWIDVGAADPELHSVTRAFAEQGWRGINVEPRGAEFARLEAARGADINLNVAVAAAAGRMVFFDCEDAGLSTLDAAVAAGHRAAGRAISEREVEVMTLAEICRVHAAPEVHFLKIDVEGAERQVLEGADFVACRPWVMVVEATRPGSAADSSAGWEGLVLAAGYRFAWFDGVNRFYVAGERWERLAGSFAVPPNVFDDFTLAGSQHRLVEIELAKARAEIALLRLGAGGGTVGAGWVVRGLRRVRGFFSAELRQELTVLRQEVARLSHEVSALGGRLGK